MYASQHLVFSRSFDNTPKTDNGIKPTQPKEKPINMDKTMRVIMPLM